ncbi:ABC transporter [Streptomyces olivochromogenes]|uniref:ABC transporter n=1 Tax=Streptomyces olivochromogenes TaxID=1963 RepID=UPI001F42F20D|nr:ABC transporter [Streptomyces olivochromogenes]MCF3134772.1 ABC transporter [Streptomyces olivochromogenes]
MSNLTKTSATRSNGSTASPMATRGPRLSGLNWLIWRQHRAGFWTLLAITAVCVAWLVYQRTDLINQLTAQGWPDSAPDKWLNGEHPERFQFVGVALGFIPIVLGVFLGAPLLSGDLENGTAQLVASQSVTPIRWLATKLAVSGLVVIVCTAALSVAFGRWWGPVKYVPTALEWSDGAAFDNTGPIPVALALFTVVGGVAIGMLLRRTLISMVVTFAFAVVVQLVWSYFRLDLGHVHTVTTHKGISEGTFPQTPQAALEIDHWYISGSGQTYGWGTCTHEVSEKVCIQKFDLVGWKVDYLPMSQMSSMQWFGASILFALTAAVTVFIFIRGRKRIV